METNLKRAVELQRQGDVVGAIQVLRDAIGSGVIFPQNYYFLAALEDHSGELDAALKSIEQALKLDRKPADFWYLKGNICQKLGNSQNAIEAFKRCILIQPEHTHGLVNLALLQQRSGLLEEALETSKRAMKVAPKEPKAWLATVGTLGFLRRLEEGIVVCDEALELFGELPELLHMKGNLELAAGRVEDAKKLYTRALEKAPDSVPILVSHGDLLAQYRNGRDGIPYLEKALALDPNSQDARYRLGIAYLMSGFPSDAIQFLLEVVQQNPENSEAFDGLMLSSLYLEAADEEEIYNLHKQWATHNASKFYPTSPVERNIGGENRTLRIGFVSPDFRNHSVARFMKPLLRHAKVEEGVEIVCYSDVKRKDAFTEELETLGGSWVYSYRMRDETLFARIQSDRVDVLVDLAGHTGNHRLFVFARKPAPLQVSWLGYPNTTGLETIDYRLSDAIADPEGRSDMLSTEKIVRMPDGFHCFEPAIELPPVSDAPVLKNGYLTFGSFNNQSKINQLTLERWAGVLSSIPNSRLILKNHKLSDERNREHWLDVMRVLGIEPTRVELLGYASSLEQHYATYDRIDIALDTFPYNGTTTTCEALWMGVPVMTIAGDTQRSRTGASLLTHAGLGEWIAQDVDAFVSLALHWSARPEELNQLRQGLREQVETSPIGDQQAFTKKFFKTIKGLW